ncbi:ATP-binding protein [Arthrobacter sp. SX1312]|uniref:ATP-binding protein n=1 Tax=Arthrobacter sp. SX1312 TaxID=2058896 RepID=UPI000CE423C4|nr:ATP-binding protein [Arthrobacter sp. SX1312]
MSHQLRIGTLDGGRAPAELDARRFNRHTFWCGQSGSGKTYALGVVLEQLLLGTRLPLLVLDPNADFVRLGELKAPLNGSSDAFDDVRVLRATGSGSDYVRVRFLDQSLESRAAVLGLDPVLDREEYNVLVHLESEVDVKDRTDLVGQLRAKDSASGRNLAMRIENLGVLEWDLWAWGGRSAEDVIDERPRATVLDLGGFRFPTEPQVAALSVLDHLWKNREERRPILIVIDEAHNLCSPDPITPVQRALTERITQIAAEGRKFGLWLLLSTQRPSKLPVNVLSQCDNLVLMKMSSPRDLAELASVFGYVSPGHLDDALHFTKGQALVAGGFIAAPSVVQVRTRLTHEGGADIAVPL